MQKYLILLVGSVFLGSELLAIPTPLGQFTIYRLLVLGAFGLLGLQLINQNYSLRFAPSNQATTVLGIYLIWWLWGIISVLWVIDLGSWFQAIFLLSVGVGSILILYLWTRSIEDWLSLIDIVWLMMTVLVIWGFIEITFNIYIFADLSNLDKYNTFASQPLTRIPITTFTNQNDYATLLLAYLPLNFIKYHQSNKGRFRFIYLITTLMSVFLIYRSESRMILLSLVLFFVLYGLLQMKWDFNWKKILLFTLSGLVIIFLILIIIPETREMLEQLYYIAGDTFNTGDSRRVNLWRNGLIFLANTLGFGVGAGNLEVWMSLKAFLPTDGFFNIHNWWLEILVGYGLLIFILYLLAYGLMIHSLFRLRQNSERKLRQTANSFIAFLLVFVFASITSANNMLIEWHWVYFGLIISLINVQENLQRITMKSKRRKYELSNSY